MVAPSLRVISAISFSCSGFDAAASFLTATAFLVDFADFATFADFAEDFFATLAILLSCGETTGVVSLRSD